MVLVLSAKCHLISSPEVHVKMSETLEKFHIFISFQSVILMSCSRCFYSEIAWQENRVYAE
jgi:predicted nucleic-acid-binding Zn-ribbon protein